MEFGRGGAYVPTRVALRGRIRRSFPAHHACVLVWKRRYADVRAGTQAPPLRILLERIARRCSPLQFRLDGLYAERLVGLSRLRVGV